MDESDKLAQFINITGVDEERARFYLESSAGELEVAISRFYENDGEIEAPSVVPVVSEDVSNNPEVPASQEVSTSPTKPKPKSRNTNSRFATVHTLNSSSDDDEEEGQAFYAGGSEHSGQQVLGPPKKKDIVADMFKSVQEHGVEILDNNSAGSSTRAFRGTGYKLGQAESDSEKITGAEDPPNPVEVTLRLWRSGFSLDNGELRSYTDPANLEFLESVRRGEIPRELRRGSTEVHLSMEDHRMETFKEDGEKKNVKPFSGQGYTLGSPAPPVIGATRHEDHEVNEEHAREALGLDSAQPVTNLQIRLADGSRLLGRFNHDMTVGQVRSYIIAARPQYETRHFVLLSSYPSKELDDGDTLAKAGLLNSAIMQKLK